jgi:hypothetical protein
MFSFLIFNDAEYTGTTDRRLTNEHGAAGEVRIGRGNLNTQK